MFRRRALVLGAALAGLIAISSADAQAQQIQGIRPEVHGSLLWDGGIGAGFRLDIPIVPQGFIRSGSIRDELAISPGLDLNLILPWWWGGWAYGSIEPTAMVQWNLYLGNSGWSIFPELGLTLGIVPSGYAPYWLRGWYGRYNGWWLSPAIAFGARYHFTSRMAIVFRLVWPGGLQVGVTF